MELAETFEAVRPSVIAFIKQGCSYGAERAASVPSNNRARAFFVHQNGIAVTNRHVIDALQAIHDGYPRHPRTRASPGRCSRLHWDHCGRGTTSDGHAKRRCGRWNAWRALVRVALGSVNGYRDLGFVQVEVRDVPVLPLVTESNSWRAGLHIATAGFPEGERTVTFHERITQVTPGSEARIISQRISFRGVRPTDSLSMCSSREVPVVRRYFWRRRQALLA